MGRTPLWATQTARLYHPHHRRHHCRHHRGQHLRVWKFWKVREWPTRSELEFWRVVEWPTRSELEFWRVLEWSTRSELEFWRVLEWPARSELEFWRVLVHFVPVDRNGFTHDFGSRSQDKKFSRVR